MMKATKRYAFDPDYAVPPGETLRETMESLGMTQKELAIRTELTEQSLIRIIRGEQPITFETASRLELVTGVPARFWNNLEAQYRELLAKLKERERLKADLDWLKKIPTKVLIDRGAIEPQADKVMLERETLKFYGVSSVESFKKIWSSPKVAARRSPCFETCMESASAWIRLAEIKAHAVECDTYDEAKFKRAVRKIRELTVTPAEEFQHEMKRLCAEAGVALVFLPTIKKVPWHGATKWLSHDKAMIVLSLFGKTDDKFWFAFFHEAAHVLNDSKKDLYINDGTQSNDREIAADRFAAEILIPSKYNTTLKQLKSKAAIVRFAEKLGIAPGIVAGRYQHLTNNHKWFNGQKQRFECKSDGLVTTGVITAIPAP